MAARGAFRIGHRADGADRSLARFAHVAIDPDRAIGLKRDHPALMEARTIFPTTVVAPMASARLLVSGHNNAKLGAAVRKGPWAGMALYQLTLEERATCPRSCAQWANCYGNAMHMARRHAAHDAAFLPLLEAELWLLQRQHPDGFVVRLHTLGDFFSVDYVRFWAAMLDKLPGLRVFGYTACQPDADDASERAIGQAIRTITDAAFEVFAIRFSGYAGAQGAIVVHQDDRRSRSTIVCPAQTERTAACATCGLCWSPAARRKTIAFLRHGMTSNRAPRAQRGSASHHVDAHHERGGVEASPTQPASPRRASRPGISPGVAGRARSSKAAIPAAGGARGVSFSFHAAVAAAAPRPVGPRQPHQRTRLVLGEAERAALVAEALAAGRVTVCPPGYAWGGEPDPGRLGAAIKQRILAP